MSQRTQIILVAIIIVLLLMGMVGAVVLTGFNLEGEEIERNPFTLGAILVGLGMATIFFIALLIWLWRDQSTEIQARGELAESEFERSVMLEVQATSSPLPPVEAPKDTAPPEPNVVIEAPGLEGLLAQLRMARINPSVEGIVQSGAAQGATILRLDTGTVALALTRPPTAAEWGELFPRYDRVFVPIDEKRWVTTERLEGFIANQMGDPL